MSTEQIERITRRLQNSGYGWISRDECRKIILLVQDELAVHDGAPLPASRLATSPTGAHRNGAPNQKPVHEQKSLSRPVSK